MRMTAIVACAVSLAACSPDGFEISTCSTAGRLAFRIHEIDGWLRDYQPRPNWISVIEPSPSPLEVEPVRMWDTSIPVTEASDRAAARHLITYGEVMRGWQTSQHPRRLRPGVKYMVVIYDGGRSGVAEFVGGADLPAC